MNDPQLENRGAAGQMARPQAFPPDETAYPGQGLHESRAMLQNLLDMGDVQVDEGNAGVTNTDHETIRVATDADMAAIRRLVNQAFEVERFLKKGGGDRLQGDGELESLWQRGTFLVKEEDGAPVGCVYVEPRGERAYLGLLSIVPARQGAGSGRQLNAAAENFARGQGCKWMDLRVVSPRADLLLPVYRTMGYVETGTEEYLPVLVEKMTLPGHFILMTKQL